MLKRIQLCIVLFMSINAMAQKVDLDKKFINFNAYNLPQVGIGNAKTYSLRLVLPNDDSSLPEGSITSAMLLPFPKVNNMSYKAKNAEIDVAFEVEGYENNFKIGGKEYANSEILRKKIIDSTEINEDEPKINKYNQPKNYEPRIIAKLLGNVVFREASSGKVLATFPFEKNKEAINGAPSERLDMAMRHFEAGNVNAFKQNALLKICKNMQDYFNSFSDNYLNNKLGYTKADKLLFWKLDSDGHPEYAAYQENMALLETILAKANYESPITNLQAEVKPILAYFNGLKTKFATDDKADKKLRYAAYYNNATIYLAMDMPNEALAEAEGIIKNGYDVADGVTLKKQAIEQKMMLENNKLSSRHLNVNWESKNDVVDQNVTQRPIMGASKFGFNTPNRRPEPIRKAKDAKEETKEVATMPIEAIDKKGNAVTGKIFDSKYGHLVNMNQVPGIILFTNDGKELQLNPYSFTSFKAGADVEPFKGASFESLKFKSSGKLFNSDAEKFFVQKIVDGPIKVYKNYSVSDYLASKFKTDAQIAVMQTFYINNLSHFNEVLEQTYKNPSYVIQKGDDNAKLLWDANMEKLFDDNAEVLSNFKAGKYGNSPSNNSKVVSFLQRLEYGADLLSPEDITGRLKAIEAYNSKGK